MNNTVFSCIIKDDSKPYDIVNIFCNKAEGFLASKYKSENIDFGVLYNYGCGNISAIIIDGICDVKVNQDVAMGDVLACYCHKQVKNKYKKAVYYKTLLALENGISGDIIKCQIVYSFIN